MFFRDEGPREPVVLTQEELDVMARVAKRNSTSAGRFQYRLNVFKTDGRPHPVLRHWGFWVIHNCVVHPMMAVSPSSFLLELHELSSYWVNHRSGSALYFNLPPKIKSRFWWTLHNFIGHMAIGILPIKPCFAFHDWSAPKMGSPDWV